MAVTWTADLNTGHRSIDMQHQDLVEMIGELEARVSSGASITDLALLLQGLQQYVVFHFSHEEAMMQRHHIDRAHMDRHLAQHADFANHVESWLNAAREGTALPGNARELLDYLLKWLVQHIRGTDMELAGMLAALSTVRRDSPSTLA